MEKLHSQELISNLDKIHTTKLGEERIRKNLRLNVENVVGWCVEIIQDADSDISRKGKNWYIIADDCEITVNAHSYTIITAHKIKERKRAFGA